MVSNANTLNLSEVKSSKEELLFFYHSFFIFLIDDSLLTFPL